MGVGNLGDPAYTIDTTGAQAIAIQGTIIGRGENAGHQGTGATEGGPMFTLTKTDIDGVAVTLNIYGGNKRKDRPEGGMYVREEDTTKCLDAANGLNPTCSQGGTAVLTPMAVRRLTPVECERLQGFPDNWSRISWKGKPEEECPDGPRYKACGNSMAVPVMRWIGERIAAVDSTLSTNA
jgi:site-specific DNA-cytosine methylase